LARRREGKGKSKGKEGGKAGIKGSPVGLGEGSAGVGDSEGTVRGENSTKIQKPSLSKPGAEPIPKNTTTKEKL